MSQWRTSWWLRASELVFWRKHQHAWREGYAHRRPLFASLCVEAVVRFCELAGLGLLVACLDAMLWAGRYQRVRLPSQSMPRRLRGAAHSAVFDDGAHLVAGRLRIAYVLGYVVKSGGAISHALLCHELVHVAQFERWGWAYVAKALTAQWWGGGYRYRGDARWLNAEQEAARVEDTVRRHSGLPERHRIV